MLAVRAGRLKNYKVLQKEGCAACVIMASEGYPTSYQKGFELSIPDALWPDVYVAGAAEKDGKLVTNGGRVLGVTARGETLREAVAAAYEKVEQIHFDNAFWRRDIGHRALELEE